MIIQHFIGFFNRIYERLRGYRTGRRQGSDPCLLEQDPWDWWRCTVSCIREVIEKSGAQAADIKVVSVSGQAPCALPVDRDGNPLCDALIWMDRRSTEEEKLLRNNPGESFIFQTTGNRLDTYFMLPKLMWLVRHCPEKMEKCHKVLQANGFINARLTGCFGELVSCCC